MGRQSLKLVTPQQMALAPLRAELVKIKTVHDNLKKAEAYFAERSAEVRFLCPTTGQLARLKAAQTTGGQPQWLLPAPPLKDVKPGQAG